MTAVALAPLIRYEALPGRVVFGAGSLAELPAEIERLGAQRVLLLDGLPDRGITDRVEAGLGAAYVQRIAVERQHVPAELADGAREVALVRNVDCLLALGGGSAIGVAKAVALATGAPIVAVPTTYAGSEMTPIWGISGDGTKTVGRDLTVLPRTVIYDPLLTVSLPPAATGASGMNAVAHCVEALWTGAHNPVTDAVATEALRLLASGLRGSVRDPADLVARADALKGAWLAGTALAVAGTALHHKICHVLGGFGLPHAEVHAAVLPNVVAHFRDAAPTALRRTAEALDVPDAVDGLRGLARDLGVAVGLRELGLDDAAADRAAVLLEGNTPASPAPVTGEEIRAILEEAMATRPAPQERPAERKETNGDE